VTLPLFAISTDILLLKLCIIKPDTDGSCGDRVFTAVCLCVCFPQDISETDAATCSFTKLNTEIFQFHGES